MKRILLFLKEAIGTVLDIWDVISLVGGIGGNAVAFVSFFTQLPLVYPVSITLLSSLVLIYGIVKLIVAYKRWSNFKGQALLDRIMAKLLEMHLRLSRISEDIIKENRRKNINTKTRREIGMEGLKAMGFPLADIAKYVKPDGKTLDEQKMYSRISKVFHLRKGKYFTMLPMLEGYSHILNRTNLGLKDLRQNDLEYLKFDGELLRMQTELDVNDDDTSLIDQLKQLSYGLLNLSIGIRLINENRSWYGQVPEQIRASAEDYPTKFNGVYMRVSAWVKMKLKRAMLKAIRNSIMNTVAE